MKRFTPYVIFAFIAIIFSCTKEEEPATVKEYNISGNVQKGPFINGSNVFIYELDKHFKPTGRSFHTTTDEKGYFELKNLKLVSDYVELLAEGFYFNEVAGDLSSEKLSLKSISDLSTRESINLNVLTDLEYDRVKYLIEKGSSISVAKVKAQAEILKIFDITDVEFNNSEALDIINTGEGDAALLAISTILQVNRTTSELSKLIADIVLDMKEDGILNDSSLLKSLATQATAINIEKVKENLVNKYKEFGIELVNLNDFDTYVNNFIQNSEGNIDSPFDFPVSTSTGENILVLTTVTAQTDINYAFAVKMPNSGSIMIKFSLIEGSGLWWYQPMVAYGWQVSTYNAGLQTFTSTVNGKTIDLPILFAGYGVAKVEYFYNGSATPAFTKTLTWGGYNNSDFEFRNDSPAGLNLLAMQDSSNIFADTSYTIGLYNNAQFDVKFRLYHQPSVEVVAGYGDYTYTVVNENELDFELKGQGNITEIALKFTGAGQISLGSDLKFKDGNYLSRTYFLNVTNK